MVPPTPPAAGKQKAFVALQTRKEILVQSTTTARPKPPQAPPSPPHVIAQLRQRVLDEVERREITMAQACRLLNCSRSRGYELLRRYQRRGAAGLVPKPRYPEPIRAEVRDEIVAHALSHPNEGPRVMAERIRDGSHPGSWAVSPTTVYKVLRRLGLNRAQQRKAAAVALAARQISPVTERAVAELRRTLSARGES